MPYLNNNKLTLNHVRDMNTLLLDLLDLVDLDGYDPPKHDTGGLLPLDLLDHFIAEQMPRKTRTRMQSRCWKSSMHACCCSTSGTDALPC